jgi:hypothetical protein
VSARIGAGLRFKRFLYLVLIDVRHLRVPPGVRYPTLKITVLSEYKCCVYIYIYIYIYMYT